MFHCLNNSRFHEGSRADRRQRRTTINFSNISRRPLKNGRADRQSGQRNRLRSKSRFPGVDSTLSQQDSSVSQAHLQSTSFPIDHPVSFLISRPSFDMHASSLHLPLFPPLEGLESALRSLQFFLPVGSACNQRCKYAEESRSHSRRTRLVSWNRVAEIISATRRGVISKLSFTTLSLARDSVVGCMEECLLAAMARSQGCVRRSTE